MRSLLVRVSVLAVVRNHVHSSVEVHRIDALPAVNGVYPRVIVGIDHVVAGSGAHRVGAALVGAYQVSSVPAAHVVVARVAPDLINASVARQRVVAPIAANTVSAARARESVVAATTSYV